MSAITTAAMIKTRSSTRTGSLCRWWRRGAGGGSSGSGGGAISAGGGAASSGCPMPDNFSLSLCRIPGFSCGTGVTGAGTRPGTGVTPSGIGAPAGTGASGAPGIVPSGGANGSGAGASGAGGSATGAGSIAASGGARKFRRAGAAAAPLRRLAPERPGQGARPSQRPVLRMYWPQTASRPCSHPRRKSVADRSPAIPTPRKSPRRRPT